MRIYRRLRVPGDVAIRRLACGNLQAIDLRRLELAKVELSLIDARSEFGKNVNAAGVTFRRRTDAGALVGYGDCNTGHDCAGGIPNRAGKCSA